MHDASLTQGVTNADPKLNRNREVLRKMKAEFNYIRGKRQRPTLQVYKLASQLAYCTRVVRETDFIDCPKKER